MDCDIQLHKKSPSITGRPTLMEFANPLSQNPFIAYSETCTFLHLCDPANITESACRAIILVGILAVQIMSGTLDT